jgi:hypothetical protein
MSPLPRRILSITAFVAASILSGACSLQKNSAALSPDIAAPHTGDPQTETQVSALASTKIRAGLKVFVTSNRLRVRSTPEIVNQDVTAPCRPEEGCAEKVVKASNIVGVLEPGDAVEIVDPKTIGEAEFIAIKVLDSNADVPRNIVLYTSAKYLDETPMKSDASIALPGGSTTTPTGAKAPSTAKLFVITNIATEKVRVYQRCEPSESCVNKLLFEQDVVNGEDKGGTRSDVGVYRISSWEKFYETLPEYPAWFKLGYPELPAPGASHNAWYKSGFMPAGIGSMRGAFGWYTLKVEPNGNGQWMHGTAGWGADKKRFILRKETFAGRWADLFGSIRSHGCTRIDNESIAYLRTLLPIGTTYVKIYAKEGTRRAAPLANGPERDSWSYILTKAGGGVTNKHQVADRDTVLASGTPRSEWIEEGTLTFDRYPHAVPFDRKKNKSEGGDLYELGARAFHGVFLVDEGTLVDYQHPAALGRGGYSDGVMPSYMISNDPNYVLPEAPRESNDPAESGTYGS